MTSPNLEIQNTRFADAVATYLSAFGLPVTARQKKKQGTLAKSFLEEELAELGDIYGLKNFSFIVNAVRRFRPGTYVPLATGTARLDGKRYGIYIQQAPDAPLSGSHVTMSLDSFAEIAARLEAAEK
ncbi:hypothetical protein [Rathayibacter caricis]|uniref:hypothetical protein n=1 Tax=Rathayibacter caricis TaxID=110936 RepID=UPI0014766436|nr:hypothetical protein [Rathayibacter caricis]